MVTGKKKFITPEIYIKSFVSLYGLHDSYENTKTQVKFNVFFWKGQGVYFKW